MPFWGLQNFLLSIFLSNTLMYRAILIFLAIVVPALSQDVRITEFMPVNTAGLQDEEGTFQPWIEIWNTNVAPTGKVNLTNWKLVNGASQWTFPAGMEIPPGEMLVVFASGKNRNVVTAPLHTSFVLNPDGGVPLQLLRSDSSVASTYATYPALAPNVSYGRDTVEIAQVGSYTNPTPGNSNNYSGSGVSGKVAFSLTSRAFTGSLSVDLTQVAPAAGAVIRYTTNGTVPLSTSTQYVGTPISVATTQVLRARVFEPGKLPGETETSGYLLLDGSTSAFNTAAPLIVVSNFGAGTFPDTGDQAAFMWVWEPGADGRSRFANLPTIATRVVVDRRGSSTLGNAKTNFNLESRKGRDNDDRDIDLLGMGSGSDWVFHAPFFYDPSLLHNPFMYALSNTIGRAAMRTRMAEVFVETTGGSLNFTGGASGDYYGLYNVMQKIRRAPDRIDIQKLDKYDNDLVRKEGGYIWKVDRLDTSDGDTGFSAAGQTMAYYYPKEVEIKSTPRDPQEQYLTAFMNAFNAALNGVNYKDPVNGYAKYVDVPAAIDHHLMNVWSFNVDALRLSGYIHKDRGGKMVFGPIWDFDRTLSSNDNRDDDPATWRSNVSDFGTDFFNYPWWGRMFTDPDFYQKYIDRWVELRRGKFSPTAVNALLDSLNAELTTEGVARDLARWNQAKRAWTSPFAPFTSYPASQAAEVQRLKDYLQQRANFFDTEWVRPVTFNVDGGSVNPDSTLTMSAATPGSTIYYTLDGTDPRPSGGGSPVGGNVFVYSGPITINSTTRVKARAFSPSFIPQTGTNRANKPPLISKWSGLRDVRVAISPAAAPADLAVTEVNYHPANPTPAELAIDPTFKDADFEFIELKNIGATAVDLNGVQVQVGATYTFDNSSALTLQPGAFVIIAANPTAFAARYGSVPNVVGPFSGDLNNVGEQLVIRSAANAVIADFVYDDVWYPLTDGGGRSLEGMDQAQLNVAAGWRASIRAGGTPGFQDIAPTITDDPDGIALNPNAPLALTVAYTGSPTPAFQWRKNLAPIPGATSSQLSIKAVTEGDEGSYDVVVSNLSGQVTSAPAVVSVNDPVVFSAHPESKTVNPGTMVTFSAAATGTAPLSFQWRKGGAPIDGATNATLSITAAEADEGTYDVLVTNVVGPVASNAAVLSVNDPVQFTAPPQPQVVNPNGSATFTVSVSGTGPFTYQWRKGGNPIGGATSAELLISPATEGDEGSYDVIVENIVGPVTSAAASLQVNDPVQISASPQSQTVNPNAEVTFTVAASGTGPLSYQWRKGGVNIDGAVGSEFKIASAAEGNEGTYDVVVTNTVGSSTSAAATLNVNDPVQITSQPKSRVVTPGHGAQFSVTANGTGQLTYQWYLNNSPIQGATGSTHQVGAVGSGDLGDYKVVITNVVGEVTSATANLSFIDWPGTAGVFQAVLVRDNAADAGAVFPGRVTATVAKSGKVTGKVEYLGLTHAFKGQFDLELRSQIEVKRRNESSLSLVLDLGGAIHAMTAEVTQVGVAEPALADLPLIPKRQRAQPAARAGQYTVHLKPVAPNPADVHGCGYLSVKVTPTGAVSWLGKLPDNATVKGSALLSPQDAVAFYSPLYVVKAPYAGQIAGPLQVTAAGLSGDLGWRKPAQLTSGYWSLGLTSMLEIESSPWVAVRNVPVITPGALTLSLQNTSAAMVDHSVSFTAQNKFVFSPSAQNLKLSVNKTTGVLTGSFFDPVERRTRSLYGALLQSQGTGEGFAPIPGVILEWTLTPAP